MQHQTHTITEISTSRRSSRKGCKKDAKLEMRNTNVGWIIHGNTRKTRKIIIIEESCGLSYNLSYVT